LITRSTDSSEFVVNIDWRDFDPEQPVFIDQIGVRITARSPKIFTGNQTGTQIEVTELRESWTRGMVRNLHRDINSICSPFDQPLEFQAVLDVEPQKKWLENLFSFDDIKDLAPYRAECLIDGDNFKVDYHFHPPGELADRLEPRKALVEDTPDCPKDSMDKDEFLHHLASIGTFELILFVFDLDKDLMRLSKTEDVAGLKRFLSKSGGISVYRNGIRVFGLGGAGEDWLNLGGRRVQLPARRISNNQVVGAVMLHEESFEVLKEQTNRRGFVENSVFHALKHAVHHVINQFENERLKDRTRIREMLSGKKVRVPVLDELAQLRSSLDPLDKEDRDRIEPAVSRVEKAYEEVRGILMEAAAKGMSLSSVIHEVEKLVEDMQKIVNRDPIPAEKVRSMVSNLSDMMEGLAFLLRKSSSATESLAKMASIAIFNLEHRFNYHGIKIINGFSEGHDRHVKCVRRLIVAALMNILDNAIHWLKNKGHEDKKIYIGPAHELGGPGIVIADNATGFVDPPEDIIIPFFSRKTEGMGIGLWLADQIMLRHEGRLSFPATDDVDIPASVQSAIVALVFKEDTN